jgi:hypothetical protein
MAKRVSALDRCLVSINEWFLSKYIIHTLEN